MTIVEALSALRVPIESIHADPANVRKHNKKNLS